MRCRDAKYQLTAQRDTEPDKSESNVLRVQEHLKQCAGCRSFERHQTYLDAMLRPAPGRAYRTISTERIMQAVERERRISQQLEHIQSQQQVRLARVSKAGPKIAAGAFFTTGALVLGLGALFLFQPEVFISLLSPLSGFIDALYAMAAWVQTGLTLISSQSWVLSGVAFMVVIMMSVWLRLMRYPREA
jgi:hypothetical protein